MTTRLWLLCAGLLATPGLAADLRQAKFTQVIKDVTVIASGTKTTAKAKLNDQFINPDIVQTGPDSLAELVADDKTVTRIGANTVFAFSPKGREVNLEQGSVLFHSPKGKGGGTIRTKAASASVLGTTIVVTATVGNVIWPRPSSTMALNPPPTVAVTTMVVPSTAAEAALVRMVPPPLPLGEWNKTLPCSRLIARPLFSKEKAVFAPTRVTVLSGAINSASESGPVRITSGALKASPSFAFVEARVSMLTMLTSLMT